jgi:hypothetical protein
MAIKRASAPHNHQHGSSAVLCLGEKSYSHHHLTLIVIPSYHSSSSLLWISQENLTGITMCKSARQISKLNRIVVNSLFLCSHFGNNREDAAYKNIERTQPIFKLSTWIIIICSSVHLVLLWYLCFVSLPVGCHAFVFHHVSLFRRKACLSVHHRDFPLLDVVMGCRCVHAIYYSHHRVSPDLSAMASPTLVVDPSDTACR